MAHIKRAGQASQPPPSTAEYATRDDAAVKKIRRLANIAIPSRNELLVLAIGDGRDAFTSGEVLRVTDDVLGNAISVTTLHRVLEQLVEKQLLTQIGAMFDFVSRRPVTGYAVTEAGMEVLRHFDAAASAIAPLPEVA